MTNNRDDRYFPGPDDAPAQDVETGRGPRSHDIETEVPHNSSSDVSPDGSYGSDCNNSDPFFTGGSSGVDFGIE